MLKDNMVLVSVQLILKCNAPSPCTTFFFSKSTEENSVKGEGQLCTTVSLDQIQKTDVIFPNNITFYTTSLKKPVPWVWGADEKVF